MSSQDSKGLVDELTRFGLTLRQAEVYVFLLKVGAASASQIAGRTGINRPDTYRLLRELLELGLVEKRLPPKKKTEFSPFPPEEGIGRLLALKKEEVDDVTRRAGSLISQLNSIKGSQEEGAEESSRLRVVGGPGMFNVLEKIFRGARKEIDVILSGVDLFSWFVRGMDDIFEDMAGRGINVLIITKIEKSNLDAIKRANTFCQIKHSEEIHPSMAIVDGKEALFGSQVGDKTGADSYDAYLWISDRALVNILKDHFKSLWKDSIDARKKIRSLRQRNTST